MSLNFDDDTPPTGVTGQLELIVGPAIDGHNTSLDALEVAATELDTLCTELESQPLVAARHRILVVEDSLDNMVAMVLALERSGFAAVPVGTASAAMANLRLSLYDAAIVDVGLPGTRGDIFVEQLRTDTSLQGRMRSNTQLPVFLVSGEPDEDILRGLAQRCGADDWLAKPFRPQELVAMIARHLPQRR